MKQTNLRSSFASFFIPSLQDVLFLALFAGVIGLGPRLMNMDGDLGRHLTLGDYMLQTGSIPRVDLFSHTLTGEPHTPHEWLAQLLFALANRLGGLDGVVLLSALLIALTFTLAYRLAVQKGRSLLLALGLSILAAGAASLHWLARPHLFTLLMVALWVSRLERLRRGETRGWIQLPLLMLLWVNLHGAFIAGFAIWVIYVLGDLGERVLYRNPVGPSETEPPLAASKAGAKTRELWLVGALAFLASFANPAGWKLWETSLGYLQNRYLVGHTAEYLPPYFHNPSTWPFLVLIALSLAILAAKDRRLPLVDAGLLAAWTAMGLYSARNIPIYSLIAVPILAGAARDFACSLPDLTGLGSLDERLLAVDRLLRGGVWGGLGAGFLALTLLTSSVPLDFSRSGNRFDPQIFPVQAVNWIEVHPQAGNVFNYFPWGGYLLYRRWPEQRVFIDGQTDFYGEALTRQYEQVITLGEGWQRVLHDYEVDWVLMPPGEPLAQALQAELAWDALYEDGTAILLRRAME